MKFLSYLHSPLKFCLFEPLFGLKKKKPVSICLAKVKYFLNLIYLELQRTRGGKRTLRKFEPFTDVSVQNKRYKYSSFIRPSEVKRPKNRPVGNTRIAHPLSSPSHTHTHIHPATNSRPAESVFSKKLTGKGDVSFLKWMCKV